MIGKQLIKMRLGCRLQENCDGNFNFASYRVEMLRKCNDDDDLNGKCMNFPVCEHKKERLFYYFSF